MNASKCTTFIKELASKSQLSGKTFYNNMKHELENNRLVCWDWGKISQGQCRRRGMFLFNKKKWSYIEKIINLPLDLSP